MFNSRMKIHTVVRDGKKPLQFTGEVVGYAEDERGIMLLYRTEGGQHVGEKIALIYGRVREEKHSGAICKTRAEIVSFFGRSNLSAQLLREAEGALDKMDSGDDFEHVE